MGHALSIVLPVAGPRLLDWLHHNNQVSDISLYSPVHFSQARITQPPLQVRAHCEPGAVP